MSDPIRQDSSATPVDQHETIERLLVSGLDHYFSGEHEQAIHVWTRVLFLDRGHARARAYIERARGALAERQRESEELLHGGVAALESGDVGRARDLLTTAVERGAPQEDALLYLGRVHRLEAPLCDDREETRHRDRRERGPDRPPAARLWPGVAVVLAAFGTLGAAAFYASGLWPWQAPAGVTAPALEEALPVPRASEVTLAQARAYFERGHLYEALRLLERIRSGDPLRAEADALRGRIQRALLEPRAGDGGQDAEGR